MPDLADQLRIELPYLRRYARALTGSQATGDDLAYVTVQKILADRGALNRETTLRVSIFALFHEAWRALGAVPQTADSGPHQQAQARLAALDNDTREALLLSTIEDFTPQQVALILATHVDSVDDLLRQAKSDMQAATAGSILIIEDEPIIAADLTRIVETAGHAVIGVARTRSEALVLGKQSRPALILADIQLADGSSGIDATHDLLAEFGDTPVIFITAFPEMLLTGQRPEPAFLITKPYNDNHVLSAVSQAMFFATTELLSEA